MRLNIFKLPVAMLALVYMSSASALSLLGPGTPSCGEWVKERKEGHAYAKEAWLMGYLSGIAAAHATDYLKGANHESIYLWVDNYCRDNPLDLYHNGVQNLLSELKKRKGL